MYSIDKFIELATSAGSEFLERFLGTKHFNVFPNSLKEQISEAYMQMPEEELLMFESELKKLQIN